MRVFKPGFIHDRVLQLGSPEVCMYLVLGDDYALIGGGVPWVTHLFEAQMDAYRVDRHRIRYLVVSHSHHDHCGAVPYLLRRYPHLHTVATDICAEFLNNERAVQTILELNRKTLHKMDLPQSYDGFSLDFSSVSVSTQVEDGDTLDLGGGLSLDFYRTPGHTRCSLSTYVPQIQALFPADALPFPEEGKRDLTVTVVYDYQDYIRSLEKIEHLPIGLVGYEHGGALIGQAREDIIRRGLEVTRQQKERIRERFQEVNDVDFLIEETAEKHRNLEMFRLIPHKLMRAMTSRMVKSALGMD